jgi:hypothetical protein
MMAMMSYSMHGFPTPNAKMTKLDILAVTGDIFTAFISQVAQSAEAQSHHFFIKRIQFAHWGNVKQDATQYFNVTLKRALRWDGFTKAMRQLGVMDFNSVKPLP